jgi:hypothetical protein
MWWIASIFYDKRLTIDLAWWTYVAYLAYVLATTVAFWTCHRQFLLRKQNLLLVLTGSIFNILATACLFCQLLFGSLFFDVFASQDRHGLVKYWLSSASIVTVYPLFLVIQVHARALHVIWADRWSRLQSRHCRRSKRAQSLDSLQQAAFSRHRFGVMQFVGLLLVVHLGALMALHFIARHRPSSIGGGEHPQSHMHPHDHSHSHAHGNSYNHAHGNRTESDILQTGFVCAYIVVYVVVGVPLVLFRLAGIRDAYDMASDLKAAMVTGVPLFAFLWINWIPSPWTHELHQMFPPLLWALGSLFFVHTFSVTAPLVRSVLWAYRHRGLKDEEEMEGDLIECTTVTFDINDPPEGPVPKISSQPYESDRKQNINQGTTALPTIKRTLLRPPKFEDALANPYFYKQFRLHLQREFSSENLLFQTEAQGFFRAFQFSTPTDPAMHAEALRIFRRFVQERSPCELNLPSAIRTAIRRALWEYGYDALIFEPARLHAYRLMQRDSYPRFIDTLSPLELEHFCLHCKPRPNSALSRDNTLIIGHLLHDRQRKSNSGHSGKKTSHDLSDRPARLLMRQSGPSHRPSHSY